MKIINRPMFFTFLLVVAMASCNTDELFVPPIEQAQSIENEEPEKEVNTEDIDEEANTEDTDQESNTEDIDETTNTEEPTDLTEIVIDSGTSSTLKAIIDELDNNGIITVTGWITIDSELTIPPGITINVNNGGGFKIIDTSSILTIQGNLIAGVYPIFNSTVNLGQSTISEVKSEWFGTTGDFAVNLALLSANTIPVKITNDIVVDSSILMNDNQTLTMYGATIIPASPVTGGAIIKNRNASNTNISITGGYIDGSSLNDVAYDAILFNNVNNSLIKDLTCNKVHITPSHDTGNITLNYCTYTIVENYKSYDTWKAGIYVRNGHHNQILNSEMKGCNDSGIALVNSHDSIIDGNYVDDCGKSDASNIACGAERIIVKNNISVNSSGKTNGNGITMGHAGYEATDAICSNNIIINNEAKGIFLQAGNHMEVKNNIVINNGINNNGTNAGGIANYTQFHIIENNYIIGNRLGVSLHNGSLNMVIKNNDILSSVIYGIRNDGVNTTVESNKLGNEINIFNNPRKKDIANITFVNNNETAPVKPTYSFLSDLNLTNFQKEVINTILKL